MSKPFDNTTQSYWLPRTNYIRKTTKSLDIDISEVKQWENAIINEIIRRTSKLRSPPQVPSYMQNQTFIQVITISP